MNCSNCGAALSVGTETHLLNCAFCGAVQRNPRAAERRPIDDLLDQVFAETGDAAFQVTVETTVTAGATTVHEVEAQAHSTVSKASKAAPDVRDALRESRRALNDLFGGEALSDTTDEHLVPKRPVVAEREHVAVHNVEPEVAVELRSHRPQVVLGGRDDYPEWTTYLLPVLLVALLAGAGVAGLAALLLH